jgi:hypothetical protein
MKFVYTLYESFDVNLILFLRACERIPTFPQCDRVKNQYTLLVVTQDKHGNEEVVDLRVKMKHDIEILVRTCKFIKIHKYP